MKISNEESLRASQVAPVASVTQTANKTSLPAKGSGNAASPAAVVEFSAHAQAIAVAAVAVDAAPDVREDLVTKFKAQVDAGTYRPKSTDIADQMLRRAQADRIS